MCASSLWPGGRDVDIRDVFGRTQHGLQLGVPSGDNCHRLFTSPGLSSANHRSAHRQQRALIATLTEKARIEIEVETRCGGEP
jgi:hypothetical protein